MTRSFLLFLFVASKNGQIVGTVFKEMKGPLFPTVAVHSQNEEYVVLLFLLLLRLMEWLHASLFKFFI